MLRQIQPAAARKPGHLTHQTPATGSDWNQLTAFPSLANIFVVNVTSDHTMTSIACSEIWRGANNKIAHLR
jgi:hypothetical protein